jgi:hypothetical protein
MRKINFYSLLQLSLVLMTFFNAPLFDYCLVRFSDIGLLLLFFYAMAGQRKLTIPRHSKWAFLFVVWILYDFLLLIGSSDILTGNYIFSAIRISLGMLIITLLPRAGIINKISLEKLGISLKHVVMFHVSIVFIYAILFYGLNIQSIFNIVTPYEKSRLIKETYLLRTHFRTIIVEKGHYRMCGIFEEPAWFGWVINLLIGIIFQIELVSKKPILKIKNQILIFGAFFLTRSLSAFAGLIIIYMAKLIFRGKISFITVIQNIFIVITGIGGFVLIFWTRLGNITNLADASSLYRVIGSFNLALNTLKNDPLTGYGLGDLNRNITIKKYMNNEPIGIIIPRFGLIFDLHNMLLSVLCTLGIVGLIIFLALYVPLLRQKQYIVLVSFIIVFFTLNVFTTYFFYAAIALSYIVALKSKKSLVIKQYI